MDILFWKYLSLISLALLATIAVNYLLKRRREGYVELRGKTEPPGVASPPRDAGGVKEQGGKIDHLFHVAPDESKKADLERFEILKTPDILIKDPASRQFSAEPEMPAAEPLSAPKENVFSLFSEHKTPTEEPKPFEPAQPQQKTEMSPEDAFNRSMGYTKKSSEPEPEEKKETKEWQPMGFFRNLDKDSD